MTLDGSSALLVSMQAPPDGSPAFWVQLIPFALILGIFYFVILLPMRKRQKKVAEFQGALKVGDRVVTTSGIHGSIVKLDDATVVLQVDENTKTRLKIARAAVGGYQGQDPVVQESGGL
jgi:preprotein translocase subunit YajC